MKSMFCTSVCVYMKYFIKMSCLSNILDSVLSDIEDYCCLCFKLIGEMDMSYNIKDEVALNFDNIKTEVMYEILLTVVGDKLLDSIPTHIICQKCTQMVINSYNFIQQCRNNIHQLHCIIESLHTKDIYEESKDVKSLFIAVDANHYNVDLYYDKNRNSNNKKMLHKRFLDIQKQYQKYIIELEIESNCSATCVVKRKKQSKSLDSLQLPDILYDIDDLNNFQCKMCMKLYNTAIKLKQHFKRVHAPKDYKCPQCPRSFGTLLLLKRHTKDSHCYAICSQCGKAYTNIYSLRYHERSHKLQLVCQTCGKTYKGKHAFNNHIEMKLCEKMRKSNAEAQMICDYCGKKYSRKTALSVHIRLEHENGKALICDWCGKKLSSMSRLKDHIITHTKQKNFECEVCGGKFVTKTSLLYHTRTHTGEKPYKCAHCDMAFLSASRRSEHVKHSHSATNLECDICYTKFKGNICLTRHRRKHFDVRSRLYRKQNNPNQCV